MTYHGGCASSHDVYRVRQGFWHGRHDSRTIDAAIEAAAAKHRVDEHGGFKTGDRVIRCESLTPGVILHVCEQAGNSFRSDGSDWWAYVRWDRANTGRRGKNGEPFDVRQHYPLNLLLHETARNLQAVRSIVEEQVRHRARQQGVLVPND